MSSNETAINNTSHLEEEEVEIEEPIKFGVSKFKNIMGVTCYMNSILHILQQIPVFAEYITQAKFQDTILNKINRKALTNPELDKEQALKDFVIFELFRLFKISLENDDSSITPTTFRALIGKKNDMWTENNHQDSQEFFNFLISQLEEEAGVKTKFIPGFNYDEYLEMNFDDSTRNIIASNSWANFQSREYSPLKNIFDGLIENNRRCMCCGSGVIRYEPYLTLPLSVPIKTKEDMGKTFSIYDCLDHMISEEQFDDQNKMTCEMCGLKNRSFSKSMIWKSPKVLVLHIKRFLFNSFGVATQKITNNVTYPFKELDLSKYFNPASPHRSQSKYDLIGINIHQAFGYGGNVNAGHYTSIVKNIMNNNWYLYNDSNPLKMAYTKENLQNPNTYMLFYYRHD
jgi:ubiquitin C-terminal hydrolase